MDCLPCCPQPLPVNSGSRILNTDCTVGKQLPNSASFRTDSYNAAAKSSCTDLFLFSPRWFKNKGPIASSVPAQGSHRRLQLGSLQGQDAVGTVTCLLLGVSWDSPEAVMGCFSSCSNPGAGLWGNPLCHPLPALFSMQCLC